MMRLADLASTLAVAALVALVAAAPAGCGGDGNQPPIDAASDADAAPDAATEVRFTGEYVSWDSTLTDFLGVFGATITVDSDATRTAKTAPNGRFDLQIPADDYVRYTVTPATTGDHPDYIGGIGIVAKALAPTAGVSMRTMTPTRAADFGYDATKAQIFVHMTGVGEPVTVVAPHAAGFHLVGSGWVAGETGTDVYIPNVEVGSGTTMVRLAGSSGLPPTVPLVAGKFTYLTADTNL